MQTKVRHKLEMLERVRQFGKTHAALFPADTHGAQLLSALDDIVPKLQQLAGTQAGSRTTGRNVTTSKAASKSALMEALDAISINARALALSTPGLEDKFRSPRNPSEQALLASARAFASDALQHKDHFIKLQMPADFLDELQADITEFEASLSHGRETHGSQVNATAAIESALSQGIKIVLELKAVVHNILPRNSADEDGLMAEWLRASRTQKSPHAKSHAQDVTQLSQSKPAKPEGGPIPDTSSQDEAPGKPHQDA